MTEILLVEDNPGDVMLIEEALRESGSDANLSVAKDGEEALAYLNRQGEYADAHLPDLILLDLNLPKKNGYEVLKRIKSDQRLRHIPVIILTTSEAEKDVIDAYELSANCYITKPADLEGFFSTMRVIQSFWLTTVKLPQHPV